MAFRKYASAINTTKDVTFEHWMDEIRAQHEGIISSNHINRIAKVVLRKADPKQYLLSHATIVASVDTYAPKGAKTGRYMNHGTQIDVRYPDFRITPEGFKIINNNADCWQRSLLLSTYKTFVGAPNYCFIPGTLIQMADGTQRPIEDIDVGEEVIGSSGLPRKVVHKHVRDYDGDVKLIYTGHSQTPVVCTPNHPFAVLGHKTCVKCGKSLDTTKRPASYKKKVQRVFCKGCSRTRKDEYNFKDVPINKIRADELSVRDILFAPIITVGSSTDQDKIRLAKVIGYYLSDGHLVKHREKINGFSCGFHAEEHHAMQSVMDCSRALDSTAIVKLENSSSTDNMVNVRVYSSTIANKLLSICGEYSTDKHIDEIYLNSLSKDEILALLAGYVDGDGDLHGRSQRMRIVSVNRPLLYQLLYLGTRVNLNGFIVEHSANVGDVRVAKASGYDHEYRIVCRHKPYVLHFDVASSKILSSHVCPDKRQTRSISAGDFKFYNNKRVTFINKIETDKYCGKVYNLEVEEDHSYVVNGSILCYNCEHIQLPELSKGFIVDAIARDLGDTCYIDILVATDRKHTKLVNDILSGDMNCLSMGCWEPSTPVTLSDGTTIPICEIMPEMMVITQAGNTKRVDNVQIRQNRWGMVRLKVAGLPELKCTDNHGIYTVVRDSVRFKKSSNGNLNPIPNAYPFVKMEAKDLVVGDIVATPIPTEVIDPGISESDARFIGLYTAEGYKIDMSENRYGVGFCIGAEELDVIDEIKQKIDRISWTAGEMKVAVGGGLAHLSTTERTARNGCYMTTRSHAVRGLVDRFVHGRRAKNKVLDRSVLLWPKNLQLAFLGGMIDGDGCVSSRSTKHNTRSAHISTRSRSLADQLFLIALRCGIITTVSKATRRGTKKVPNGAGVDYQLRFRNDSIEQVPSDKIRSFAGTFNPEISRSIGNSNRWISGNHLYARIKSINTYKYDGFVYDLQVDDDHTYTAGGIGVSNCISQFTICTKCGNVAFDDAQLCSCILYDGKGTTFKDENGEDHPIAELIGHVSVPESNSFIEASWVKNPAFSGAVRRNFLNADTIALATKMNKAGRIYEIRKQEKHPDELKRAAFDKKAQGQDTEIDSSSDEVSEQMPSQGQGQSGQSQSKGQGQGGQGQQDLGQGQSGQGQGQGGLEGPSGGLDLSLGGGGSGGGDTSREEGKEKPEEEGGGESIDAMLAKAQDLLIQNLVKSLEEKLKPKDEDVKTVVPVTDWESSGGGNDNIVRSSREFSRKLRRIFTSKKLIDWADNAYRVVHIGGIKRIRATRMTPRELLILSWIEDRVNGKRFSSDLYKVALCVGTISSYPSTKSYVAACGIRLGRALTAEERRFFIWKGTVASLAEF